MEINEIASKIVEYCRSSDWETAQRELYAENAISIEPGGNHNTQGLQKIIEKGKWFDETFDIHSVEVSEPIVAGNSFAISLKLDTTNRKTNEKTPMEEICLYEVEGGKISKEQFF